MRIFIALLLLCFTALPSFSEDSPFKTVQIEMSVYDKFQRPFVAEPESVQLGVRLAQGDSQKCEAVTKYEQLSAAGTEYPRQTEDFLKFPVENGVARPQFVVFTEAGKNPVDYELVLFVKDKKDSTPYRVAIDPNLWKIGTESQNGDVKAEQRAPHGQDEIMMIGAFTVGGLLFSYLLFGRSAFTRFLHNKRMEVGSALGWSNLLVIFSWLCLFVCTSMLIFFPIIVWQKTYWIYVLVIAGYALLLSVVYGLCLAFTRR